MSDPQQPPAPPAPPRRRPPPRKPSEGEAPRPKRERCTVEILEARLQEVEERMLRKGQHPAKVQRDMGRLYGAKPRTVRDWIHKARKRWQDTTSPEDLADRQQQLELMAHELYERALGEIDPQEVLDIAAAVEDAIKRGDQKAVEVELLRIVKLKGAVKPNLKVAASVLGNLGRFYGLGTTLKLDIPGIASLAGKPDASKPPG